MRISEEFLRPGMVLANNLYKNQFDKVLFLFAERVLTENDIEKIRGLNKRIKEDNTKIPKYKLPLVSPNIKTNIDNNETIDNDTKEAIIDKLRVYNIQSIIENSKQLIQKVLNSKYYSYDLSKYLMKENDEYSTAVEICGFAVAFAKVYNDSVSQEAKINIQDLAVATLLNNIGSQCRQETMLKSIRDGVKKSGNNTFLDKRLFTGYDDTLFDSYVENVNELYGYANLKNNPSLSSVIKATILLQDEDLKGTGPLKTIPTFMQMNNNPAVFSAKILKICKMYDKVLNKVLKKEETPSNIIEVMNSLAVSNEIDPVLTKLFLKNIPLYSVGTKVILSNNSIAEVVEINEELFDRPKVKIEATGFIIDLAKINIITIKKIANYNIEDIMKIDKQDEVEENMRVL